MITAILLMALGLLTKNENKMTTNTSLHYLVKAPKTATGKAIILLHGVGSNEEDLFSLAAQLPDDYYIISARGQYTLGPGRYAWYNVDFSSGKPVFDAAQELSSRQLLTTFIKEVKEKYQLKEIYLGGFSQGAIMSYSVGLTNPAAIKGIIAMGGRILEEAKPGAEVQQLKVFVAHGVQDNTLPIHYPREAKAFLEQLKVTLSYHEYNMGHQISPAVIGDLNKWLERDL